MRRLLAWTAAGLVVSAWLLGSRAPASVSNVSSSVTANGGRSAAPNPGAQEGQGLMNERERREEHEREFLREHSDRSGRVRPDLWRKGIEQYRQMRIAAGVRPAPAPGGLAPGAVIGVQWTQIGPAPLIIDAEQNFQGAGPDSGEVVDIAIDPRNTADRVIFIATNDGGIWRSTDAGTSWEPKTDFMPSLSMGSVALDPGNASIVYAGTGNLFDGGTVIFKGVGIYKSIDSGETWSIIGGSLFAGLGINRMVLPAPNVLLVGSGAFPRCSAGSGAGLYRSIDGGLNFGANPPLFNDGQPILNGCISDLDLDSANSMTVYASVSGQGIFVSTDGGVTFPTNLFSNTGAPTSPFGFIAFTQSTQPDNQTMYASVQGSPYKGLFKSTNAGGTWTTMANAAIRAAENNGCQCGYDQTVGVDPQDANRVYIGFQELYLSTDGGANFGTPAVSRNDVHWDHHALIFSPRSHWDPVPTRIYVGTDGGIATSDDGGSNWANINEGIATNLFLGIDIGRNSSGNNDYTYGGTQDTGTIEHQPGFTGTDWHLARDGDGGPVVVDPSQPLRAYGSDNGGLIVTTDGGSTWPFPTPGATGLPACPAPFGSNSCAQPIAVDPTNPAAVYVKAGAQLFQSMNTGATFTSIKTFTPNITVAGTAALDSNSLWIGFGDGTLQRTSNALAGTGSTWTPITVAGAPGQGVAGIAIDPSNTDVVMVVYPGFCGGGCAAGNRTRHVFQTIDNGVNWTDISGTDGGGAIGDLPDLPLHSVVIDPGTSPHTIIVSSDAGVLRSANNGATWEVLGVGLPTVDSKSLAIDPSATPGLLRIGTYGRSTFELTAASGPLLAVNADLGFGATCVGTRATRIVQIFNVGSQDLHISSFFRASGSNAFSILSGPPTPVTVLPGEEVDYTLQFQPSSPGDQTAIFQINSDDALQPASQLPASGTGTTPNIVTLIADSGSFGDVCRGSFRDLNLTISESGGCDLSVSNITSSSPEFLVAGAVSFPLVVAAGGSVQVPIRFAPTALGAKAATLTITSSDPDTPIRIIPVSGNVPPGDVRVTGSTSFGDVCPGALAEKTVSVCNVGACNLAVTSVAFEPPCADFTLVNNPFPAAVSPDSCDDVVIRFTPTSPGPKTCTLVVRTDDPDSPVISFQVTGNTPFPMIDVPPNLTFAPTVIQSVGPCDTRLAFPISNTGACNLVITDVSIVTDPAEYSLVGLPSFPIILQPGHVVGEGNLRVRFAPNALGRARSGQLRVVYVSDPITGATTTVNRQLCGEGVQTGARMLVTVGGSPINQVKKIQIARMNGNQNGNPLDTIETIQNVPLATIVQGAPCSSFQFHREWGTAGNPVLLLPGSYRVFVTVRINGRNETKRVGFDVSTCDFNPTIVVNF